MKKIMSVRDFKFEQGVVCRNAAAILRMKDLIKLRNEVSHQTDWVFFPHEQEHCDLVFARDAGFDLVEYSDIVILEDCFRDVKRSLESFENGWAIVISNQEQWDLFAAYCDLLGVRNSSFGGKVSFMYHNEFPVAAFPKRGKGLVSSSAAVLTSNNFVISFEDWVKGDVSLKQFKKDAAEKTLPSIPLKDFKDNWTIWCDTEAEWDELRKLADAQGLRWNSGDKLTTCDPFTESGMGMLPGGGDTPNRVLFTEWNDFAGRPYIRFKEWKAGSRTFSVGGLDSVVKRDITDKLPVTDAPTAHDLMSSLEKSVVDGKAPAIALDSPNNVSDTNLPTYDAIVKAVKFIKDFGVTRNPYMAAATGATYDFTKDMTMQEEHAVKTNYQVEIGKPPSPYQEVKLVTPVKGVVNFQETVDKVYNPYAAPKENPVATAPFASKPVSSPAKKENSMLAPLVFVSSAVRRAAWSALDWAFVSPIKKTVKPVGTVAQFTICYTTLALIGYLAYSAYSDPTAMVSWISELSPVEIRFKQPQE